MRILILLLALLVPALAAGQDILEENKIYKCYSDDDPPVLTHARDKPNDECPGPAVDKTKDQEWLNFRKRVPTQQEIDRQYEKFYCQQEGVREFVAAIAQLHNMTPAGVCDLMKGKRR